MKKFIFFFVLLVSISGTAQIREVEKLQDKANKSRITIKKLETLVFHL